MIRSTSWTQLLLKGHGFSTEVVPHPARASLLETGEFDAVLMDLNYARDTTSGSEDLELVSLIRLMDQLLPVVVMTAARRPPQNW
jgi:CheY-like chemotaxis protein